MGVVGAAGGVVMFLRPDPSQMNDTHAREQRTSGAFLMLFCREIGGEIRACVRSVKLRQCCGFVAGHATLAGVQVFLNGPYGHHGLPLDCGEQPFPWLEPIHPERVPLWEKLTPVPGEFAVAYWCDYTGRFGPFLRQWAIDNESELRTLKTGRADREGAL